MDEQKKQLLEKIKSSTNILVTVSSNPSVDQLSACIGLTLVLNKLEKHATAVFSGQVPSMLEFLKPDKTLEKNTDSLRDFIIALDKSKADKLRYKLEDNVVKIFITPYRTSLTADDLDFSQGDFNVDMVVALGVHQQADLDQAITAHGRILHDATVTVINTEAGGELGSINWQDTGASSLAEMVTDLTKGLGSDKPVFDEQIATALLTGIVAATDRFRNARTSATTMSLSGELIAAGANQQLVADRLEQELEPPKPVEPEAKPTNTTSSGPKPEQPADSSGMLQIEHPKKPHEGNMAGGPTQPAAPVVPDLPDSMKAVAEPAPPLPPEPTIPPRPDAELPNPVDKPEEGNESRPLITEAPSFGGPLTANVTPEHELPEPLVDPLGMSQHNRPFLRHDDGTTETGTLSKAAPVEPPKPPIIPPASSIPAPKPAEPSEAPAEPAIVAPPPPADMTDVDSARNAVLKALSEQPAEPEPIVALNAQPLGPGPASDPSVGQIEGLSFGGQSGLPAPVPGPAPASEPEPMPFAVTPADQALTMPTPPSPGLDLPPPQPPQPSQEGDDPHAPPPVPPPMLPPLPPVSP